MPLLLAKIHKTKQKHFLLARWSTCLLSCFDAFIHCDVLKLSSILTANYFKSHGPCGQWFASWFSFSNRLASSAGIHQTPTVPKKSWIESSSTRGVSLLCPHTKTGVGDEWCSQMISESCFIQRFKIVPGPQALEKEYCSPFKLRTSNNCFLHFPNLKKMQEERATTALNTNAFRSTVKLMYAIAAFTVRTTTLLTLLQTTRVSFLAAWRWVSCKRIRVRIFQPENKNG